MPRAGRPAALAGAICAGMFAFAFVAAPSSCAWGLEAYALVGAITVGALAMLPFARASGASWRGRAGGALLWACTGGAVWIAGLFAANVRIICRLF
jgi:hypothetical protein